jgi:hypothetical protein
MERRFVADWAEMTPTQRAEYCIGVARKAQELASAEADLEMRQAHLEIADQWLELAALIQLEGAENSN